jgi:hypothetical protein
MRLVTAVLVAAAVCLAASVEARAHGTYVAYYEPCCAPPVVVTSCGAPAPVAYPSYGVVRTRYRPVLGGRVTRGRYVDGPVIYGSYWW